MEKKFIWLLVNSLMVLALVLASCAPAKTREKDEAPPEEEVKEEIPVYEETFSVGETVQSDMLEVTVTDNLSVTITEIFLTDSYDYYRVFDEVWDTRQAPPGSTFLIAHVIIKNISGTDTYKVGTGRMRGGDVEGDVPPSSYMGEDPLETSWPVPPGDEIAGEVQFEVPKESTGYYVKYRFSEEPEVWAKWPVE